MLTMPYCNHLHSQNNDLPLKRINNLLKQINPGEQRLVLPPKQLPGPSLRSLDSNLHAAACNFNCLSCSQVGTTRPTMTCHFFTWLVQFTSPFVGKQSPICPKQLRTVAKAMTFHTGKFPNCSRSYSKSCRSACRVLRLSPGSNSYSHKLKVG